MLPRFVPAWLACALVSACAAARAGNLPDFSALVSAYGPAVVNISSENKTPPLAAGPQPAPAQPDDADEPDEPDQPGEAPLSELFEHFFDGQDGGDDPSLPSESLGSGFIISSDGYVLTNHHVVKDAEQIIVRLGDRSELPAKLVGSDERSDVALLKVTPNNGPLPTVKIGDPARLKVGEWVLAIGSPFGFDHSVTAGIVSAKGRALPQETYVPFIQTDVAINPGNSGGPLFNMDGEVVGINSQIYSRTGGFMGLSFAVPIDVAMDVVEQLKTRGTVTRGWLGVLIQDVTRDLAESFGMPQPRGALVARVMPGGPAAKAGIEAGDVILRFDGTDIVYSSDLPPRVGRTAVGRQVAVQVLRGGQTRTLQLAVAALPTEPVAAAEPPAPAKPSTDRLGLRVADLSEPQRQRAGLEHGGVLVRQVQAGAALDAGVQRGDLILSVNNQRVADAAAFERLIERLPAEQVARLLVQRGDDPLWLALRVPKPAAPQ